MNQRSWSSRLSESTRQALQDIPVSPDGLLHLKNLDGCYASIDVLDLIARTYRLRRKSGDGEWTYPDVDAVLAAGWAID